MKYLLFLFFLIALVRADYTNCTPPNSPFNLTSLVLVPDPPKIGLDAQVNATGILSPYFHETLCVLLLSSKKIENTFL
jgi:hypothetical protein